MILHQPVHWGLSPWPGDFYHSRDRSSSNYLGFWLHWDTPSLIYIVFKKSYFPRIFPSFSLGYDGFLLIFPAFSQHFPWTSCPVQHVSRQGFPLGEMPQLFRMTAEVVDGGDGFGDSWDITGMIGIIWDTNSITHRIRMYGIYIYIHIYIW